MANIDFSDVTASAKANIYFDGKVISHTLVTAEGDKKTLGLIFPGEYHFGTELARRNLRPTPKVTHSVSPPTAALTSP